MGINFLLDIKKYINNTYIFIFFMLEKNYSTHKKTIQIVALIY